MAKKEDKNKKAGKNKKEKEKVLSKKELILANLAKEKISKALKDILSNTQNDRLKVQKKELRAVSFMIFVQRKYPSSLKTFREQEARCYELYAALDACKRAMESEVANGISEQLILDIQDQLNCLEKPTWMDSKTGEGGINYALIFKKYPRLLFSNLYDDLYKQRSIEPYEDQKQVIRLLRDEPKTLIFLNTMPGSGKTTNLVTIAADLLRNNSQTGRQRRVLFVCSNSLVLSQVGRDAHNAEIPFAIAADNSYRVTYVTINKRAKPVLIISDMESSLQMLEKFRQDGVVLFIDEPTIAAESPHPINEKLMRLMLHPPSQTILSSATLPRIKEWKLTDEKLKDDASINLISQFEYWHESAKVVEVSSTDVAIGCRLVYQDRLVLPFEQCKSMSELHDKIQLIKRNPFLYRCLTMDVVLHLRDRLSEAKNTQFQSLKTLFPLTGTNHKTIANHCIELLESIAKIDDDTVQACCRRSEEHSTESFDLLKLLTTSANRYLNGALFATNDPISTAKILGDDQLVTEAARRIQQAYLDYEKKKEEYHSLVQSMEKNFESFANSRISAEATRGHGTNKSSRADFDAKIRSIPVPTLDINFDSIPNTAQHMAKHAPSRVVDSHSLQAIVDFDRIPDSLSTPEWMRALLYLGIGIYCPSKLNYKYTELVLTFARNRQLAYLFADRSIVYGTNLPFSNVFVSEDFAEVSSLNTLFQLMGRAGRVGQSFSSQIIILDPKTRDRVVSQAEAEDNQEARTLRDAFRKVANWRQGY